MIVDFFVAPFIEFSFMRRALVGMLALSLAAGPLGIFLMLRRMSLVGDAMAHAILPGAAIGYLLAGLSLSAMTIGGLAAGIIVALMAGLISRITVLREDAALASFYLLSLALGVVIVSLRGSNIDLLRVLFGSVLSLDDDALFLLAAISSLTMMALAVFYRPLVMECVDPGYLRSVSRSGGPLHLMFLALLVLNLVAGFHAIGTLLAVGMMMLPAVTARLWSADMTVMIGISMIVGVGAGLAGLLLSYHAGLPVGPAIILAAGVIYVFSLFFGRAGGIVSMYLPRRHATA